MIMVIRISPFFFGTRRIAPLQAAFDGLLKVLTGSTDARLQLEDIQEAWRCIHFCGCLGEIYVGRFFFEVQNSSYGWHMVTA